MVEPHDAGLWLCTWTIRSLDMQGSAIDNRRRRDRAASAMVRPAELNRPRAGVLRHTGNAWEPSLLGDVPGGLPPRRLPGVAHDRACGMGAGCSLELREDHHFYSDPYAFANFAAECDPLWLEHI